MQVDVEMSWTMQMNRGRSNTEETSTNVRPELVAVRGDAFFASITTDGSQVRLQFVDAALVRGAWASEVQPK